MNWVERLYEIKGKDLYSQNGEGLYLEYILHHIQYAKSHPYTRMCVDIGGGDGFYLSNSRHLKTIGYGQDVIDKENGDYVNADNIHIWFTLKPDVVSIDIDGNDYWILQKIFTIHKPLVIIAEFNAAFSDSRAIKYNPDHEWDGTDYYGFSFEAGKKLFERHGYKVIFNVANMNMIAVRADLVTVTVPTVTYEVTNFFEMSKDREWVFV